MANIPVTNTSSNSVDSAILKYQNCRRKADDDLDDNTKKVREAVTKLKKTYQKNEALCDDAFRNVMDMLSQSGASNSLTLSPSGPNKSGLRTEEEIR